MILFENLLKPGQRRLELGLLLTWSVLSTASKLGLGTDLLSLICKLKARVGTDLLSLICNFEVRIGTDLLSLICNFKVRIGTNLLSLICKLKARGGHWLIQPYLQTQNRALSYLWLAS